jgi:hypothetical protein
MEPAMNPALLPDASGKLAGRPLEEWNAAYVKVENYFHALRIRNKPLLGQLVLRVLERAQWRAPDEPDRSATQLAAEEMDHLVTEWFSEVLQTPPTKADQTLSTRGRLALLLADMPGKWQEQFLRPGPWPQEFVSAMRESFLQAGPDGAAAFRPGSHHHADQPGKDPLFRDHRHLDTLCVVADRYFPADPLRLSFTRQVVPINCLHV